MIWVVTWSSTDSSKYGVVAAYKEESGAIKTIEALTFYGDPAKIFRYEAVKLYEDTQARNFREIACRLIIEDAKEKLTKGINQLDVLRLLEKCIELLKTPSPLS